MCVLPFCALWDRLSYKEHTMDCARTREIQENVIFEGGGWEMLADEGIALFRRCLLMIVASGIIKDSWSIKESHIHSKAYFT